MTLFQLEDPLASGPRPVGAGLAEGDSVAPIAVPCAHGGRPHPALPQPRGPLEDRLCVPLCSSLAHKGNDVEWGHGPPSTSRVCSQRGQCSRAARGGSKHVCQVLGACGCAHLPGGFQSAILFTRSRASTCGRRRALGRLCPWVVGTMRPKHLSR